MSLIAEMLNHDAFHPPSFAVLMIAHYHLVQYIKYFCDRKHQPMSCWWKYMLHKPDGIITIQRGIYSIQFNSSYLPF